MGGCPSPMPFVLFMHMEKHTPTVEEEIIFLSSRHILSLPLIYNQLPYCSLFSSIFSVLPRMCGKFQHHTVGASLIQAHISNNGIRMMLNPT